MFANKKREDNLGNFLSCSENIRLLQAPKLMYGSGGVRINPVTVLVGAVLPGMGSVKAFVGCLAALQIGTFLTNLTRPAAQNPKRFVLGCEPGCSGNVCQKGGRCLERWNRKYRCYCWGNPFVGRTCDKSELDNWTIWRLKGFVIWSSGVYQSEIYQHSIVFMALCVIIDARYLYLGFLSVVLRIIGWAHTYDSKISRKYMYMYLLVFESFICIYRNEWTTVTRLLKHVCELSHVQRCFLSVYCWNKMHRMMPNLYYATSHMFDCQL